MKAEKKRRRAGFPRAVNVTPVILAAGASRRLGVPKALVRLGGSTLLEIAVRNCRRAARPIVVLGHAAGVIRRYHRHLPVRWVVNPDWPRGQLSSFLAGLRAVPPKNSFLLYPIDYPLVPESVVRALLAHAREAVIAVPSYRNRCGHPVLFAASLRREFLSLPSDATARDVVYRDRNRVTFVPAGTPAIWQDVDTPEDLRRVRSLFR